METREIPVEQVLDFCFEHGLAACIDISITLDNFPARRAWADQYPNLYLTAGIHPGAVSDVEPQRALSDLRGRLQEDRVIALGEIGLDRPGERENSKLQYELFRAQLEISREVGVPVVIHNRDAEEEIYELVRRNPPVRESIMHCYSGSAQFARKFVDLGFVISFAGNLTFKKGSEELRTAAAELPLETLLLETDAPFLAPEPARGRPNHPGYLGHTYVFLASLRNEPLPEITETLAKTAERVFRVPLRNNGAAHTPPTD